MNRCVFFILVFKIEYIFILKEVLDVKINIRPLLSRQGHTLYRIRYIHFISINTDLSIFCLSL